MRSLRRRGGVVFASNQRSFYQFFAATEPARARQTAHKSPCPLASVLLAASVVDAKKDASPFLDRDRARAGQIGRLLGARKNR